MMENASINNLNLFAIDVCREMSGVCRRFQEESAF